jgi:hypothetical protein
VRHGTPQGEQPLSTAAGGAKKKKVRHAPMRKSQQQGRRRNPNIFYRTTFAFVLLRGPTDLKGPSRLIIIIVFPAPKSDSRHDDDPRAVRKCRKNGRFSDATRHEGETTVDTNYTPMPWTIPENMGSLPCNAACRRRRQSTSQQQRETPPPNWRLMRIETSAGIWPFRSD